MTTTVRNGLLSFAVALAAWQLLVWATGVRHFILPGPDRVAVALWENAAFLAENAVVTVAEMVAGLLLGTLIGVSTAFQLMLSSSARRYLAPVLVFMQAVPLFALAPVITLWIGYGFWSVIAVNVLIVYFPLTWSFYDGLRTTPQGMLDLARVMGASERAILFQLRAPVALPSLGTGLKLATIYTPVGAVFGEWVGGTSMGLGYVMFYANQRTKIDLMFAALFVLALLAVLMHAAMSRLGARMTAYAEGAQIRGSANSSELPAGSRK